MREYVFSESDLADIRRHRLAHPSELVKRKLDVLWLKAKGLSNEEVVRLTELPRRTVQRHLAEFFEGGLAATFEDRSYAPQSDLDAFADQLREHFDAHPPRSVRQAQKAIQEVTGLRRGLTQVRRFLKKVRPGVPPVRRDPGEGRPGRAEALPG